MRPTTIRASAGTGKTHQVVGLYEALLLHVPFPAAANDLPPEPPAGIFDPAAMDAVTCDQILMLTFARNAAAEMRVRVTQAIEKRLAAVSDADPLPYWRLLRKLAGADISTIHSFAQRLLSENALAAGVSPGFAILEDDRAPERFREIIEDTVLEALGRGNDESRLLDSLCQASGIAALVREIQTFADKCRKLGVDPGDLRAKPSDSRRPPSLRDLQDLLARLSPPHAPEGGKRMTDFRNALADTVAHLRKTDPDAIAAEAARLLSQTGSQWSRTDDKVAKANADAVSTLARLMDDAASRRLDVLLELAADCLRRYEREKSELGALDFEDLLSLALRLVRSHPDTVRSLKVVIVDEAQDNSRVQNDLIRAIREASGATVILCGDSKQSIHTWRGAEPQSMARLEAGTDAKSIALSTSYRSQAGLIEWVNALSASPGVFGAAYREAERLRPRPDAPRGASPNVEILLPPWESAGDLSERVTVPGSKKKDEAETKFRFELKKSDLKKLAQADLEAGVAGSPWVEALNRYADRHVAEARAVARRIRLLCSPEAGATWRPEFCWDERARTWTRDPGVRPAYRDVAILLRTSAPQPRIEAALRELGIPYTTAGKGRSFFFRQEVLDLASLLLWLAAPQDDVSFFAVARSPLAGLSDAALAILARGADGKIRAAAVREALAAPDAAGRALEQAGLRDDAAAWRRAAALLNRLRALAGRTAAVDLLRCAIRATGYDAVLAGGFHGAQRLANMRKFLSLVQNRERRDNLDLAAMALWLRDTVEREEEADAAVFDPDENAVRICTVHAAKGLTFPVVFLPGLCHGTRSDTARLALAQAPDGSPVGVAASLAVVAGDQDDESRAFRTSSFEENKEERRRLSEEESRRLLYVAVTRARDLVVLSGETPHPKDAWRNKINAFLRSELETRKQVPCLRARPYGEVEKAAAVLSAPAPRPPLAAEQQLAAAEQSVVPSSVLSAPSVSSAVGSSGSAIEHYRLPATALAAVPQRQSGENDEAYDQRLLEYRRTALVGLASAWRESRAGQEAGLSREMDAAETGTAVHAVLESLDFARPVQEQIVPLLRAHNPRPDTPGEVTGPTEQTVRCGPRACPPRRDPTRREFEVPPNPALTPDHVLPAAAWVANLARKAAEIMREMPFVARFEHDNAVVAVDGKIDLLCFADNAWHIVDYKVTDATSAELLDRYGLQLRLYRAAVSAPAGAGKRRARFATSHPEAPFRMYILAIRSDGSVTPVDVPADADPAGGGVSDATIAARALSAARLLRAEIMPPSDTS